MIQPYQASVLVACLFLYACDASKTRDETGRDFKSHAFRQSSVELPAGYEVSIDEQRLSARQPALNSRCGGTTVTVTREESTASVEPVVREGTRCETWRYTRILEAGGTSRFRLVCEARGEFEGRTESTICDEIVESFALQSTSPSK